MGPVERDCEFLVSAAAPQCIERQALLQHQHFEEHALSDESPRARIVLAEDNDDLRFVMQAVLESEGYRVLACPDGRAALQVCRSELAIDLLLTDFDMPYLNGIELATEVALLRQSLPTMLVSGSSLSVEVLSFVRLSGWQFVQKPFPMPDLLKAIRVALCSGTSTCNWKDAETESQRIAGSGGGAFEPSDGWPMGNFSGP